MLKSRIIVKGPTGRSRAGDHWIGAPECAMRTEGERSLEAENIRVCIKYQLLEMSSINR